MTRLQSARLAFIVLGCVTFQAGCCDPGKYTGGGWLCSAKGPPAKATFGMNMQVDDKDRDGWIDWIKGMLEYDDKGCGVRFHGTVDCAKVGYVCSYDPDTNIGYCEGDYEPQPKKDA